MKKNEEFETFLKTGSIYDYLKYVNAKKLTSGEQNGEERRNRLKDDRLPRKF